MHSCRLQCFPSSCKRVTALQAQKTSPAKRRRLWTDLTSGHHAERRREEGQRAPRKRRARRRRRRRRRRREDAVDRQQNVTERETHTSRYIVSCPVMMRFAYDIHQTSRSFGHLLLNKCKKGYISPTGRKQKKSPGTRRASRKRFSTNQGSTLPDLLKL